MRGRRRSQTSRPPRSSAMGRCIQPATLSRVNGSRISQKGCRKGFSVRRAPDVALDVGIPAPGDERGLAFAGHLDALCRTFDAEQPLRGRATDAVDAKFDHLRHPCKVTPMPRVPSRRRGAEHAGRRLRPRVSSRLLGTHERERRPTRHERGHGAGREGIRSALGAAAREDAPPADHRPGHGHARGTAAGGVRPARRARPARRGRGDPCPHDRQPG